jgi:hypothetical protein
VTKEQFIEAITARVSDLPQLSKSALENTFPNGTVKAFYCVRRWVNADGGTYQFYVLTDAYFVDLTITSNTIKVRQIKLQVESLEKAYKIERMLQFELDPTNIILRLKDAEPINLMKPERTEIGSYHDFLKSLLEL